MLAFKIAFLDLSVTDLLDIIVVALLFYQIYKFLRGTLALNTVIGIGMLYLLSYLVSALQMKMLSKILQFITEPGFLFLLIVFQPEVRKLLFYLGKGSVGKSNFWEQLWGKTNFNENIYFRETEMVYKAIKNIANAQLGALIIFADKIESQYFNTSGVVLQAEISSKLLESIFSKTSPLHDGAVLISDSKIVAASCILPVSKNPDLPGRIGLRHRAAVGITETIDVHALIVSEETGMVSWAYKGNIERNLSENDLKQYIQKALSEKR